MVNLDLTHVREKVKQTEGVLADKVSVHPRLQRAQITVTIFFWPIQHMTS